MDKRGQYDEAEDTVTLQIAFNYKGAVGQEIKLSNGLKTSSDKEWDPPSISNDCYLDRMNKQPSL